MGLKSKSAAPAPEAAAPAEQASYPEVEKLPPENELQALLGGSEKETRIMYAGLYQALAQSQALYAVHNIVDVDTWHQAVEDEVDHFVRRVLTRARKA